jgi:hypothetical protein
MLYCVMYTLKLHIIKFTLLTGLLVLLFVSCLWALGFPLADARVSGTLVVLCCVYVATIPKLAQRTLTVRVNQHGLEQRAFFYHTIFIRWEDIQDISRNGFVYLVKSTYPKRIIIPSKYLLQCPTDLYESFARFGSENRAVKSFLPT